jgi:thiamine-monophosphate kinase
MSQPVGEFELIERHFLRPVAAGARIGLGIGDDCALIDGGADWQWAVTSDMLLEGVHFLTGVDPESLGHKSLAVNLSDLAACGALPRCFFLALALPASDEPWVKAFTRGLFALADRHACQLAGGDTTRSRGGLVVSITALGEVPRGGAILRSGARPGDDLWVSGHLGDGALGLACRRGEISLPSTSAAPALERLDRPQPRVSLGRALIGVATSAIDVSDGLAGDLGHILRRSGVGARLEWERIPRSSALQQLDADAQQRYVFRGGDDYELLFSAPADRSDAVLAAGQAAGVPLSRIGALHAGQGLTLIADGRAVDMPLRAFDHFGL